MVAGVRLLDVHGYPLSVRVASILVLICGAACDCVQRGCWGVFARNECFPMILQAFRLSLGVLPAAASIVVAQVRLLQNPCFSISFMNMLALIRGAACDCVYRDCWGALRQLQSQCFYNGFMYPE